MSGSIDVAVHFNPLEEEKIEDEIIMSLDDMMIPSEVQSFESEHMHKSPSESQDDISVIINSSRTKPCVKLVSRSAIKWKYSHRNILGESTISRRVIADPFEPWDFSKVAFATDEVQNALDNGRARAERPPREGVSGTYFIRRIASRNSVLCVFKPADEEAEDFESLTLTGKRFENSVSQDEQYESPEKIQGSSNRKFGKSFITIQNNSRLFKNMSQGFYSGEGAFKEVAAYLLDHDNFANVPQTALVACNFESNLPEKNKGTKNNVHQMRTKMGAFQIYVTNVGDADDFGPGVFSKDQVHKITILDIRTLNHDRHGGNLLVVKNEKLDQAYDLIPIDHGYILPDVVRRVPWPIWMDWSVTSEPMSNEVKLYISRLDAYSESIILDEELEGAIRSGSLRSLKIATSLLQKGSAAGLTLYDIGLLIYAPIGNPDARSELQKIIEEAEDAGNSRKSHMIPGKPPGNNDFPVELNEWGVSRSSDSLQMICSQKKDEESFFDDFIVRYASKRITELIRVIKEKGMLNYGKSGYFRSFARPIGRARSIPDFGIGTRPMNAVIKQMTRQNRSDMPEAPSSSPTLHASSSDSSEYSRNYVLAQTTLKINQSTEKCNEKMDVTRRRQGSHKRIASERNCSYNIGSSGIESTMSTMAVEIEDHVRQKIAETKRKDSEILISTNLPPIIKRLRK